MRENEIDECQFRIYRHEESGLIRELAAENEVGVHFDAMLLHLKSVFKKSPQMQRAS